MARPACAPDSDRLHPDFPPTAGFAADSPGPCSLSDGGAPPGRGAPAAARDEPRGRQRAAAPDTRTSRTNGADARRKTCTRHSAVQHTRSSTANRHVERLLPVAGMMRRGFVPRSACCGRPCRDRSARGPSPRRGRLQSAHVNVPGGVRAVREPNVGVALVNADARCLAPAPAPPKDDVVASETPPPPGRHRGLR
jgi:hypothetical protein